jgi:hypothetical protein
MLSSRTALSLLDRLCRFVYRHADQLVVLSPGFRRALIDRGVPENRIQVIYNWAPDDALAASAGPLPSYNKRTDEFRVVFAGTMGFAQALDAVLEGRCSMRCQGCPRLGLCLWVEESTEAVWKWKRVSAGSTTWSLFLVSPPISHAGNF